MATKSLRVEIENTYAGRVNKHVITAPEPKTLSEAWWERHVWPHTGDGKGQREPATYTATIIEANNPALVGQEWEWSG